MKYRLLPIALLLLLPATLSAQQEVNALRIYLGTTASNCEMRAGIGSPEGVQSAVVCTQYLNVSNGVWWNKASGTGSTGWQASASGTVTSIAMTVPTGLSITPGTPITASGTFALTLAAGYTIPGGGTSGQVLRSQGASAPAFSQTTYPDTITSTYVPYATAGNTIGSSAELTYDEATGSFKVNGGNDLTAEFGGLGNNIRRSGDATWASPEISFYTSRNTIAAPTAVVSGKQLGDFYFRAYDGASYDINAGFGAIVDGAVSAGVVPSALHFSTENSAGSYREVMRVDPSGKLGVGTGATVSAFMHALGTTEQLRLGYDVNNYLSATVSSVGVVTLNATSGTAADALTLADAVTFGALTGAGVECAQLTAAGLLQRSGGACGGGGAPAALTKADDTNVTLTLGGTPATALLQATSITAGWTGTLSMARGGSGANITPVNGGLIYSNATTMAVGAVGNAGDWAKSAGAGAPLWSAPAALTKTDDTNVTMTLGGSASTSLLNAASLTLGWTGTLSLTRGGTAANLTAVNGGVVYSTAGALAIGAAGTDGQPLTSTGAGAPSYSSVLSMTATGTTAVKKAPIFLQNNLATTTAGQGNGFWMQLADTAAADPSSACNTANPVAGDFVAYYSCQETTATRNTATIGVSSGMWGGNFVLTAQNGENFSLVGLEIDIQNLSGEGAAVPAAFASNGKVGVGVVMANTATPGDGSAGFVTHLNGGTSNQWKYGFEAGGVRTASFYARPSTNGGTVHPTNVLLDDTSSTNVINVSTGVHTYILNSTVGLTVGGLDIFGNTGSGAGRVTLAGTSPIIDMYEIGVAADAKYWRLNTDATIFTIQTVNDAYNSASTIFSLERNGEVLFSGSGGTSGQVLTSGGNNAPPTWTTIGGTGTVTSVAQTVPTGLSIAGSPVTTSGTLAITLTAGYTIPGGGSAGQHLQSAGASAPTWTTATFPATATGTGTILRADGTNWAATTATYPTTVTVNRLLWASATNVISDLATANSGVLVTSGAGVPSIATDIPTAVTIGGAYSYRAGGTDIDVVDGGTGRSTSTTAYGLLAAGTTATGVHQTLAAGTAAQILTSGGAAALPTWITVVPGANGGTGYSSVKNAGIMYTLDTSYVDGTGTAGTDATAMNVKTIAMAANTLTQVGDRIRIRVFWRGDTGAAGVIGTLTVNGVSVAVSTSGTATAEMISEANVYYLTATTANVVSYSQAAAGAISLDQTRSANAVASFAWTASQNIIFAQNNSAANRAIVYSVVVDVLPKGVVAG